MEQAGETCSFGREISNGDEVLVVLVAVRKETSVSSKGEKGRKTSRYGHDIKALLHVDKSRSDKEVKQN